jgi:hypothetical protein
MQVSQLPTAIAFSHSLGRFRPFAGLPTNGGVGWISDGPLCDGETIFRTFIRWLYLAEERTRFAGLVRVLMTE